MLMKLTRHMAKLRQKPLRELTRSLLKNLRYFTIDGSTIFRDSRAVDDGFWLPNQDKEDTNKKHQHVKFRVIILRGVNSTLKQPLECLNPLSFADLWWLATRAGIYLFDLFSFFFSLCIITVLFSHTLPIEPTTTITTTTTTS